ncbi:spindle pole body component 110-like [Dorcoceras hygrometricum]|uniref:Spindle pole body component 110-like n=1 Tax=Dorcoceras hygrometricum TaxID=472368 RepID=A0A2Z7D3A8_9LAMI|nr:spindle pole body component 110-like [Dorcoceras hygrometricum]
MSSWAKSSASLDKLFGIQKPASDRTGLGFNSSDSSEGETSTQSQLVYEKFNKMSFVKANVIHDPYESMTYNDQTPQKLNHKAKAGIGFQKPENSKPSWLKNKLDKDKAKAGRKSFVPNQPWRSSTKVKSGWKRVQPKRDLNGQNMKSKLNRSHNYAQTLTDSSSGKTVKSNDGGGDDGAAAAWGGEERKGEYRWASGESSTTKHRLLHASGPHPTPPPDDPN